MPERVTLKVRVIPRSSRNKLEWISDGVLKAWVTASPTDGQANEALCALLAEALSVPKRNVEIELGYTAREKRIAIAGIELDVIRARLGGQS